MKNKRNNGITLIALVVTIIVLLILAGISIAMLSGNNGILQRTTEAKEQTIIGQEKEIIALAYNSALAKKVSNGDSTAVTSEDLNAELINQRTTVSGSNPITIIFDKTGNIYEVDSYGKINEFNQIPITKITIGSNSENVPIGEGITLTANIEPANATEHIKWVSMNEEIATVNEDTGEVKVLSTATVGAIVEIKATTIDGRIISNNSCIITATQAISEINRGVNPETYGRNVNYGVDLGTSIDNNQLTWKVFYDDGTNVYLIASDYVQAIGSTCPVMTNVCSGIGGYVSGHYAVFWELYDLDYDMWPIFRTYKSESDINRSESNGAADIFTNRPNGTAYLTGRGLLGFWKNSTTTSDAFNAKLTACLMDTKSWSGFVADNISSASNYNSNQCYAIGAPTLSMWVESWNAKHGINSNDIVKTQLYYNRANSIGYNLKDGSQPLANNYDVRLSSSSGYTQINNSGAEYTDDLYFPRKARIDGWGDGYWLASPSAMSGDDEFYVDCFGFVRGGSYSLGKGIRPVVCLPANVKVSDTIAANGKYDIINKQ